jgi:mevalonate kinase
MIMPSIIDYAKDQSMEHIIVNDLIEKLQYLMSIRFELFDDLKELDDRIDEIVDEMREAGVKVNKEEIRP